MKSIIKKFNNSVKRTIFKVQNKTNNNFNIDSFNKYLLILIASLFLYIFYLLIPLLYDKTWVQSNIESKLFNEFKIDLRTSTNISYRIIPSPHFLIKNSKILVNDGDNKKSLAEIKILKVFLSQSKFFEKKNMNIHKILINEANFSLLANDLKLLNDFRSKNFSNKKIEITDSIFFLKDGLGEIISIIQMDKAISFFDNKKLLNFFDLKGKVFNVPFTLNLMSGNNPNKHEMFNFNFKSLKLDISNKFVEQKNKLINGENIISSLNSKINTKYNIKEKLIIFESYNSRLNNSKISYNGVILTDPFDLNLNIYLDNYKISKLYNINPILIDFIQSGLLFNENISLNTSVIINSNIKNTVFHNAKINFNIINGKINFNETKFVNDKIGTLQLINSNIFLKNNNLTFNSDLLIDIKNSDHLFSFLNANKSLRKNFKNILINLDYDFLNDQIKFNNIKIDNNEVNDQLLTILEGFNGNDLNNFNKSRRLVNKLLNAYEG